MKTIWFKQTGWTYIPVHGIGYIITLLAVLLLVPVYITITQTGHSVSDNLFHLFIYTSCTGFWWKWIAEKTSI
jgi:hypothetical protein